MLLYICAGRFVFLFNTHDRYSANVLRHSVQLSIARVCHVPSHIHLRATCLLRRKRLQADPRHAAKLMDVLMLYVACLLGLIVLIAHACLFGHA